MMGNMGQGGEGERDSDDEADTSEMPPLEKTEEDSRRTSKLRRFGVYTVPPTSKLRGSVFSTGSLPSNNRHRFPLLCRRRRIAIL